MRSRPLLLLAVLLVACSPPESAPDPDAALDAGHKLGTDYPANLAGDVTGAPGATTLSKIQGVSVPSVATGYLFYSGGAFTWNAGSSSVSGSAITGGTADQLLDENHTGTSSEWFTPSASSDVTFASHIFTVVSLSGNSPIAVNSANLQWAKGVATPSLTQLAPTSDLATTSFTVLSQPAFASASTNKAAGNLVLDTGASVAGGVSHLQIGQTNAGAIGIGYSSITTTVTGGLAQQTGAWSLTGNAASQATTTVGNTTIDSAAVLQLGTSTATSISEGNSSTVTSLAQTVKSTGTLTNVVGSTTVNSQGAASGDFSAYGTAPGSSGYVRCTSNGTCVGVNGNIVLSTDATPNVTLQSPNTLNLNANGANTIVGLTDSASTATLTVPSGLSGGANITQSALASTSSGSGSAGATFVVQSQAGQAATGAAHNGGNGGNLYLASGAGGTSGSATAGTVGFVGAGLGSTSNFFSPTGSYGLFEVADQNAVQFMVGNAGAISGGNTGFTEMWLGTGTVSWAPSSSNYMFAYASAISTLILNEPLAAGSIDLAINGNTSTVVNPTSITPPSIGASSLGTSSVPWGTSYLGSSTAASSPYIELLTSSSNPFIEFNSGNITGASHNAAITFTGVNASGVGMDLDVGAQQGGTVVSGPNNNGGNLVLQTGPVGTGGTGGSNGLMKVFSGNTEVADMSNIQFYPHSAGLLGLGQFSSPWGAAYLGGETNNSITSYSAIAAAAGSFDVQTGTILRQMVVVKTTNVAANNLQAINVPNSTGVELKVICGERVTVIGGSTLALSQVDGFEWHGTYWANSGGTIASAGTPGFVWQDSSGVATLVVTTAANTVTLQVQTAGASGTPTMDWECEVFTMAI